MEIPLKIQNIITLRVSAVMATLSGGMRRRKRDMAERVRLMAEEEGEGEGREDRTDAHTKYCKHTLMHVHTPHTHTHTHTHTQSHTHTITHTHTQSHTLTNPQ